MSPRSILTKKVDTTSHAEFGKGDTVVAESARTDKRRPLAVETANPSSKSSKATNIVIPPVGWIDDEDCLGRRDCWSDNPRSTKDDMKKYYGLANAQPIWRQNPDYGNIKYIFQAEPPGKVSYYWIDELANEVCRLDEPSLEVIRDLINEFGQGKGYELGLKMVELRVGKRT